MSRKPPQPKQHADAILCADLHLRDDTPVCRTDDYQAAQASKVAWLRALQEEQGGCPILCAGDVFDRPKPSHNLVARMIRALPPMVAIPGQHDLPSHRAALLDHSGLEVLQAAGIVNIPWPTVGFVKGTVRGIPFGGEIPQSPEGVGRNILLIHELITEGAPLWLGCKARRAEDVLKAYPGYDLIVSGDNHTPFVAEYAGRLLVNPGSLMRMDADQAEHRPRVYLWWARENRVEPRYAPIESGVVSREHIERPQERDARIEAFVARLGAEYAAGLDFRGNLERFFVENRTRATVRDMVWEAMGDRQEEEG